MNRYFIGWCLEGFYKHLIKFGYTLSKTPIRFAKFCSLPYKNTIEDIRERRFSTFFTLMFFLLIFGGFFAALFFGMLYTIIVDTVPQFNIVIMFLIYAEIFLILGCIITYFRGLYLLYTDERQKTIDYLRR